GGVGDGRPYAKFGIIVQTAAKRIRIEIIAAARVVGCRDCDAFGISRAAGAAELCHEPAIGGDIVLDYRVAGVAAGAGSAERRPQRTERRWSAQQGATLIEDRDLAVNH